MVVSIDTQHAQKNRYELKVWITGCYRESAIYHLCIIYKIKEMGMRLWIFFTLLLIGFASTVEAKVVGSTVPYRDGDVDLSGYLAYDDSIQGKRPGVLLVHEWWGLNDYARRRADQLAGMGYVAFAVDMYGKGKVTEHPEDAAAWAQQVRGNIDLWRKRAMAGLDVLKADPRTDIARIAAIGYCFGGSTVQQLAYAGAPLRGIVSFHGGLVKPSPGGGQSRQSQDTDLPWRAPISSKPPRRFRIILQL